MQYSKLVIQAGHENLFGEEVAHEEIVNIISNYSLSSTLDLLCKIDVFLTLKPLEKELATRGKTQSFLSEAILPLTSIKRIHRQIEKSEDEIIVWSRGTILLLRKLAILSCPLDGGKNIYENLKTVEISRLFLGANDYYLSEDKASSKGDLSEEEFRQYCMKSFYLNREINIKKLITRAYLMFDKLRPSNTVIDSYLKDKLGFDFNDLVSVGFAIMTLFLKKNSDLVVNPMVLNFRAFFATVSLDEYVVNKILSKISIEVEPLEALIQDELEKGEPNQLGFYDRGIFTKHPIVNFHDGSVCVLDLLAFIEKFTSNFIWITGEFNTELQRLKGDSFENYLRYLLEKYCKEVCSDLEFKYINDHGKSSEELGDAIILDRKNKRVFVFEAKSRQFKEEVKSDGELEDVVKQVLEASIQMDKCIRTIIKGNFLGFKIETVYPIIVFYEDVPAECNLLPFFRKKVKEKGLLTDPRIAPLEIAKIIDIETVADSADNFSTIISNKHQQGQMALDAGLHNYLCAHSNVIKKELLQENFDEAMDKIKKKMFKK